MRRGADRDILLGYVNAYVQAFGVYIREMQLGLLRIFVGNIQTHMIQSMYFHLLVNGTSDYITGCQTQTLVIFLHELLAIRQTEYSTIPSHCLRNQVCGVCFSRMEQSCRMELHKFHILNCGFGSVSHGYSVTCRNIRVGGCRIYRPYSSRSQQCDLGKKSIHLAGIRIQNIRSITFYIRGTAGNLHTQMMLRNDFNCKMVLKNLYIRIVADCLHQAALYLKAGVIGMMQDSEFRMSTLTMQIKRTVFLTIEIHTPLNQAAYSRRGVFHHLFNGF